MLTNFNFAYEVVTTRPDSKVCTTSLDSLINIIDTKEWVALKSNKTKASNLSIGTILM